MQLSNNQTRVFQLQTESGGINGKDQQCLTYYYYMGNVGQKIINIRKEEVSGESMIIDSVTSGPFNGWIVRRVSFNAEAPGYKIYFEVQRTNGFQIPNIGLDEISIHQGSCGDEPITDTPATTLVSLTTTTTSITVATSTTTATITTITVTTTTTPTVTPTTTTTTNTISTQTAAPTTTTTTISTPTDSPSTTTTTATTTSITATDTPTTITIITATPIQSTTTPVVETTTTSSHSEHTTTITTTLQTSTIAPLENVVISSYEEVLPREKSHIIVMATIIPIVWIAFIVTLVWMRRSTGVLGGVFDLFPHWSRSGESSGSYELTTVSEA
ncbi:unnamed protein product [Adineta steineri]|uniref:MAM domain-containing protein n=1 Tax=Adineta steineri TaxID=433720 RepID=A0A820BAF0_9BILA|nr:unnamed protein product [Adineta steineri]CAF4203088.1 unnamed protein product [Adineta steineri]